MNTLIIYIDDDGSDADDGDIVHEYMRCMYTEKLYELRAVCNQQCQ